MSNSLELVRTNESVVEARELEARKDAFGNMVRLLWDPRDNSLHLSVCDLQISIRSERAKDAMEHPYPLLYETYGGVAVDQLTTTVSAPVTI